MPYNIGEERTNGWHK